MTGADLETEMCSACSRFDSSYRAELIAEGVLARDIDEFQLCGIESVRVSGDMYRPIARGRLAIITPVRVYDEYDVLSPESLKPEAVCRLGRIIDLVAWDYRYPDRWALRAGNAQWLGCIEPQYLDPDPVPIRRGVLDWFRANCTGLVLLTREPTQVYQTLSSCRGITAEDHTHAAELRSALLWSAPPVWVRSGAVHVPT
jgi:hypothetical protein